VTKLNGYILRPFLSCFRDRLWVFRPFLTLQANKNFATHNLSYNAYYPAHSRPIPYPAYDTEHILVSPL